MALHVLLVLLPLVRGMRLRMPQHEENPNQFCVLTEKSDVYPYGLVFTYKLDKCTKTLCHAFGLQNQVIKFLMQPSYDTESKDCTCSTSGQEILVQQMKSSEKCTWLKCWQNYVNILRIARNAHEKSDKSSVRKFQSDHGPESIGHWDATCAPTGNSIIPTVGLIRDNFFKEQRADLPKKDLEQFCKVEEIMELPASSSVSERIDQPLRTIEENTTFTFDAVKIEHMDEQVLENETVYEEEPDCGEGEFNENCVLVPGTDDQRMAWKDSIAHCIGDRFLLTDGTKTGFLLGVWIPLYLIKAQLEIYVAVDKKIHFQLSGQECCFELDLTDAVNARLVTNTDKMLTKKFPLKIHNTKHFELELVPSISQIRFVQDYGIREVYRYNPNASTLKSIAWHLAQQLGGMGRDEPLPRMGMITKKELSVKNCVG